MLESCGKFVPKSRPELCRVLVIFTFLSSYEVGRATESADKSLRVPTSPYEFRQVLTSSYEICLSEPRVASYFHEVLASYDKLFPSPEEFLLRVFSEKVLSDFTTEILKKRRGVIASLDAFLQVTTWFLQVTWREYELFFCDCHFCPRVIGSSLLAVTRYKCFIPHAGLVSDVPHYTVSGSIEVEPKCYSNTKIIEKRPARRNMPPSR